MNEVVTSTADLLGNSGSPLVATLAGKRFKFKLIDQAVKAAVEQHVLGNARDDTLKEADDVPEHVFRMQWQAFSDNQACGVYRWGGRVCVAFLKSAPGVRFLVEQCCPELGKYWPAIEEDEVELRKLIAVMEEVMTKSFPAAAKKKTASTPAT